MPRSVNNVFDAQPDGPLAAAANINTSTNSVSMEEYNRCRISLYLTQAGAGTATVTLKQGFTNAGSTLNFSEYWKDETGTNALVRVSASALTTAGAFTGINAYHFEVRADELTPGNKVIRMNVASISNNTAAMLLYRLYDPRHPAKADDMIIT
jgi:hypothetical protein